MKKSIKIACIGNMNNMMFTACRYLRDYGYDAQLFLFEDEAAHFLPGADSYDRSYEGYTTVLPIRKSTLLDADIPRIIELFNGINVYIGTDVAPALLTLIGKRLDIFVPHGSDIYTYPFERKKPPRVDRIWWLKEKLYVSILQKAGIEECSHIFFPEEYEKHFPFRNKLKTKGKFHNFSLPMLYLPQYRYMNEISGSGELEYASTFNRIRKQFEMVVFSHARQNGVNLPAIMNVHEKGNNILIEGFAAFLRKSKVNACLVLFEYGMDVETSKKLVAELKIEKHVMWMPKMQRKEIMYGLMRADIGCGEFFNSWLTCGVVNETLALGKPLLHFRDDSLYSQYTWLYPVMNANTANKVEMELEAFYKNPLNFTGIASKGRQWIEEFTVKEPMNMVESIIRENRSEPDPKTDIQAIKRLIKRKVYLAKVAGKFIRKSTSKANHD